MSKVVVGAVALVVVAGGGVGFASWSGKKVGNEMQKQTAELLAPFAGAKVVENTVTKGLFKSTHTVAIDVGCPPSPDDVVEGAPPFKPTRISWRSDISHGPLPGGTGFGLAHVDTELVLTPEQKAAIAKVMGADKAPFKAHSTLGLTGAYTSEITSPAFKFAEEGKGSLDWQGVKATFSGHLTKGIAAGGDYTLEAPGLTFEVMTMGEKTTARMGAVKAKGTIKPNDGSTMFFAPSSGKLTLANFAVTGTRPDAAGPKPFEFVLENMEAESDTTFTNGLVDGVTKFSAKGRVDDFPIDKVEAQVSIKRFHAITYEQMFIKSVQSAMHCGRPAAVALEADQAAMMNSFATLLTHNPEYSLDRFAVTVGGKTAELSYAFGSKGVTAEDASQPLPALLMTKGYGKAAAKIDMGFVEQIVKKVSSMRQTPEQSAESLTATSMAFVNMMIDQGVAQGYAVREGEVVKSDAAFEAGKVTVNGKPMALPMLGGQ